MVCVDDPVIHSPVPFSNSETVRLLLDQRCILIGTQQFVLVASGISARPWLRLLPPRFRSRPVPRQFQRMSSGTRVQGDGVRPSVWEDNGTREVTPWKYLGIYEVGDGGMPVFALGCAGTTPPAATVSNRKCNFAGRGSGPTASTPVAFSGRGLWQRPAFQRRKRHSYHPPSCPRLGFVGHATSGVGAGALYAVQFLQSSPAGCPLQMTK